MSESAFHRQIARLVGEYERLPEVRRRRYRARRRRWPSIELSHPAGKVLLRWLCASKGKEGGGRPSRARRCTKRLGSRRCWGWTQSETDRCRLHPRSAESATATSDTKPLSLSARQGRSSSEWRRAVHVDVRRLRRHGGLEPGRVVVMSVGNPAAPATILSICDGETLRVRIIQRSGSGGASSISATIEVAWDFTHDGNPRVRLRCPPCGAASSRLYEVGGTLRCARCRH